MDPKAVFNIGYGLYVLTAREGQRHNGCIVNTVQQLTSSPLRISVTVNKENLTHDMIARTGLFNASVLSQSVEFSVFQHFGFQSGRNTEKITGFPDLAESENDLTYLTRAANAYLSGRVFQSVDLGSHTLFLAELVDAKVLSSEGSVTYSDYHARIKPKPAAKARGWRCRICGYIYEGEELPADFICPLCKHGAVDFEKI